MTNADKRFLYWALIIITFSICVLRVIYYYDNGQAIASAHLDGHFSAASLNFFIAFLLIVIICVVDYVTKQKEMHKWFVIPVIIAITAVLHLHIGGLFECCPGG